jgi:hypothetical protein
MIRRPTKLTDIEDSRKPRLENVELPLVLAIDKRTVRG